MLFCCDLQKDFFEGGYAAYGTGAYRGVNAYGHAFPSGPYRSEASLDVISSSSALNCHVFDEACRWSNTNEDELDWKVRASAPEAESFIATLGSLSLPDTSAAVLSSSRSNGWEAGQLISDQISCMTSPLQLTATVWRSLSASPYEQPNLQVCSRNVHNDLPVSTCNLFPIQNGIPVTVSIPLPKDPMAPTQIVLLGDNFVGPNGGAIFMQDLFVDGRIEQDCSLAALDNPQLGEHAPAVLPSKPLDPLRLDTLSASSLSAMSAPNRSPTRFSAPSGVSSPDTLFETCITLSCNPVEAECKWRSGRNGWLKASAERTSNPLTGVNVPPAGMNGFLVAPFMNDRVVSYQMISTPVNVPLSAGTIYFCFYEYFATDGMRLALCIDKSSSNCFYSRSDINIGERIEVSIVAENRGANRGDIGFVPVRLARNPSGTDVVC
ncbi:hypothetical protein Tcan_03173 [Toxocara canis]|uniref:MAM domain-containing protein n=1 Tax=Toxocara canis TaxID=6265 RepID=A0A0B2V142_TOXCA|nr:hypothetical protein Tcan_03173 [Toxocara canis]